MPPCNPDFTPRCAVQWGRPYVKFGERDRRPSPKTLAVFGGLTSGVEATGVGL
jgi:hypothetical protein